MKLKIIIILLYLIFINYIVYNEDQTKTSQYNEITLSGSEKWILNNIEYNIEGTALIGEALFVVKVLIDETPTKENENMAKQIAKYAIMNDYFMKAKHTILNNQKVNLYDGIGIAIIKKDKILNLSNAKGYRFNFKTIDLLNEINTEKLPESLNSNELNKLIKEYIEFYNINNVPLIYNMYGDNAKKQVSFEKFKNSLESSTKIIDKITEGSYSEYIYLGKKGGLRGYYIYYDIKFTSNNILYNIGTLRIQIVDEEKGYSIYGFKTYIY
jgi:hypothetical protein